MSRPDDCLRRIGVASSAVLVATALWPVTSGQEAGSRPVTVRVTEGTSMAAALSPDKKTLVLDLQGTLWTLGVGGGEAKAITDESLDARQPVWSPDGRQIAFQGYRAGTWDIWAVGADGAGLRQLTWDVYDDREPDWAPDGRQIAFSSDRSGNYDIWTLDLDSGVLDQVTRGPANEFLPAWSPDGRAIAYASDRPEGPGIWAMRDGTERQLAPARGALGAPTWTPDGAGVVFSVVAAGRSRLLVDGRNLADEDEDVFPFRPQWLSPRELLYTADGKIKRRSLDGGPARVIEFAATFRFDRPVAVPRRRSFPPMGPQETLGLMHPMVSPDGQQVAFAALGDLWVMTLGAPPRRLTRDPYLDTDPAWSPDGSRLAFASDRAGTMDVWVRDLKAGTDRRLTTFEEAELAPVWSPDGRLIAFLTSDGGVAVVDVASGGTRRLRERLFDPGRPTWAPDGRTLLVSVLKPYSTRFREGTNQILRIPVDADGGAGPGSRREEIIELVPHKSAGMREDYGPVWSPDGTALALIVDGVLSTIPVDRMGRPIGPLRRLTAELANSPSWTGDGRRILYQTTDRLKLVDVVNGAVREVEPTLTWLPKVVTGGLVVHAGRLLDGRTDASRSNVDVVIAGNRIERVEPHRDDLHARRPVVDASRETVMPGLIEMHAHLNKAYGERLGRIWLAFGVTTVRNPAAHPFEAIEDREAVEAGVRVGPRVFTTGSPFDGPRIYYAGGTSLDGGAELDLQLERARRLRFDLIKTYVRLPDPLQKRVIDYAHRNGMVVTSHELYPAVAYGADGVEHIRGTSRRGYSPKVTALNRTYRDVIALLAASGMTITPTIGIQGGFQLLTLRDPSWLEDERIKTLFPPSATRAARQLLERESGRDPAARAAALRPLGRFVAEVVRAGGRVVAGTDAPIIPYGLSLHTELEHYVEGGLRPFQALQAATAVAAAALGMAGDLGTIEPGKLADLVMVDGDPLTDIRAARRVRRVIKDGELLDLRELLRAVGPASRAGKD